MIKVISVAVLVLSLAACALPPKPQLTRAQWLEITTRYYDDVSVDDVLNAAEKLFRLADEKDFQFSHSDNELYAFRSWSAYMVIAASMGTDQWQVTAVPTGGRVRVSLRSTSSSSVITAMPTVQGDLFAATMPGMTGMPTQGTALYALFWSRMDFLLGKSTDWIDCDDVKQWYKQQLVWGDKRALCDGFNITDSSPVPGENERRALIRELEEWEYDSEDSWEPMPKHLQDLKRELKKEKSL